MIKITHNDRNDGNEQMKSNGGIEGKREREEDFMAWKRYIGSKNKLKEI